ncbi:hypothetical protein [Nonomuraea aridisoli]|uniref:Uncharacterized protein n=1 Tax=Nonomuraea aridisoli TaxID=2070368 RepID=A0A2W2EQ05_9ACTN|nr:hypothetical protein [Nonomuraea aridisoli]PZG18645.1 hypothetical protein C1J01_14290 [Nonomuraea aridisoli]
MGLLLVAAPAWNAAWAPHDEVHGNCWLRRAKRIVELLAARQREEGYGTACRANMGRRMRDWHR